ncbi:MAG: hypothetical protein LBM65_07055 [Oscillospiraceae bacterium]|jgi:hypothetical protein|nr:hypothetical protein [Oscillospiraceae bacterium]
MAYAVITDNKINSNKSGFSTAYGAAFLEFDNADNATDIFSHMRQALINAGTPQVNSFAHNYGGREYIYTFNITPGKPIFWDVKQNRQIVQDSKILADGTYVINTYFKGFAYKHEYFSSDSLWLKTVYILQNGTAKPDLCAIMPYVFEGEPVVLKYTNASPNPIIFKKCDEPQSNEASEILSKNCPPVNAVVFTGDGYLYFADEQKRSVFNQELRKIEAQTAQNKPQQEEQQPINDGFSLEFSDFNPPQAAEQDFNIQNADYLQPEPQVTPLAEPPTQNADNTQSQTYNFYEEENLDVPAPPQKPEFSVTKLRAGFERTQTPDIIDYSDDFEKSKQKRAAEQTKVQTQQNKAPATAEDNPSSSDDNPFTAANLLSALPPDSVIASGNQKYYYYGSLNNANQRHGYGKTLMQGSKTAYDGSYKNDKRDGFGVFYYKNGEFCYAGDWKQNQKDGVGLCRRDSNGDLQLGKWQQDKPFGITTRVSKEGEIVYIGQYQDGKRDGVGITFDEKGNPVVSVWKDDDQQQVLYSIY